MLDGHALGLFGLISLEKYASEKHQLLTKLILTHLVVGAIGLSHAEQEMGRLEESNEIILTSSDDNTANYCIGILSGSNALLDAHDGHCSCCFIIWVLHLEHSFTKSVFVLVHAVLNWTL